MRVAIHCGGIEPHLFHHFANQHTRVAPVWFAVHTKPFGNDLFAGHAWAEASERILKDDLHVFAQGAKFTGFQIAYVVALETDWTFGADKPHDRECERCFARTTFPHNAQRFACSYCDRG